MKKRLLWLLSPLLIVGLISCGGGSKEAKELLLRILSLIGIPQNIVVNICQDKNKDGFCSLNEVNKKISVKKGTSITSILNKITSTDDGRYLPSYVLAILFKIPAIVVPFLTVIFLFTSFMLQKPSLFLS